MSTTPDNNSIVTTWRDIADDLTAEQRTSLEHIERDARCQVPDSALLEYARRYVEVNLADMAYDDVPAPADAISVNRWEQHVELGWCRGVVWCEFREPDVCVAVDGWQRCDGTVLRAISIYLNENGQTFNSDGAWQLAKLLTQAAEALAQLGGQR